MNHKYNDYPESVGFVLTKECNLDCIMCTRIREEKGELHRTAIDRLWHVFKRLKMISWQGGEVFLVPYFSEVLGKICIEFPEVAHCITTNGHLIDSDFATLIDRGNIRLQFSIDSISRETYQSIRRGADFSHLLDNLSMLCKKTDKSFALTAVAMRSNLHELIYFPEFCHQYHIDLLTFSYLFGGNLIPEENIFKDPALTDELSRIVVEVKKKCLVLGIRFSFNFEAFLDSNRHEVQKISHTSKRIGRVIPLHCNRPWNNLFIYVDGSVRPACECIHGVGNIFDSTFEEIWHGELMNTYRKKIISGTSYGWCNSECLSGIVNPDYRGDIAI